MQPVRTEASPQRGDRRPLPDDERPQRTVVSTSDQARELAKAIARQHAERKARR